jgi:alkylated DNA nucleotide flippase Atl1
MWRRLAVANDRIGGVARHPTGEDFTDAVIAVIRAIPTGEVLTYGEVAVEAGRPGAARAVGMVLARGGGELPWWRVVAANGRLVPGHEREHARRLRAEGVTLRVRPTRVAMSER